MKEALSSFLRGLDLKTNLFQACKKLLEFRSAHSLPCLSEAGLNAAPIRRRLLNDAVV